MRISPSPISFHTSFWIKSESVVTFRLFAPQLSKLSTEREDDSIVTLLDSVPVATTRILTFSLIGEMNHPRRATTVKRTSSHSMLLNLVRV